LVLVSASSFWPRSHGSGFGLILGLGSLASFNMIIIIIIIIDNRGLNTRWCLTPLLLSLPTTAYLGELGLTPAGLPHTTAQCHLTILGDAVLFCI